MKRPEEICGRCDDPRRPCAGALSVKEFGAGLGAVGLTDVSATPTHFVADGMHGAIIKATKPASAAPIVGLSVDEQPVSDLRCCRAGGFWRATPSSDAGGGARARNLE